MRTRVEYMDEDTSLLDTGARVKGPNSFKSFVLPYFIGAIAAVLMEALCVFYATTSWSAFIIGLVVFIVILAAAVTAVFYDLTTKFIIFVLVGTAAGFLGGLIGGHFLHEYHNIQGRSMYRQARPTMNPSRISNNVDYITFTPGTFVDTHRFTATYETSRYSDTWQCVAPIVSSTNQTNINFWAVEYNCCSATHVACAAWHDDYRYGAVVDSEGGTQTWKIAISTALTHLKCTSPPAALLVEWVADPGSQAAQQSRRTTGTVVLVLFAALYPLSIFIGYGASRVFMCR